MIEKATIFLIISSHLALLEYGEIIALKTYTDLK